MPEPSFLTPLLPNRSSSRMRITPSHLWRTGAIFGSEFPQVLCVPHLIVPLLPVVVGMTAGAFGTHALRAIPGFSSDNVATFLTAAHYAVNASQCVSILNTFRRFVPLDIQWPRFVPRLDAPTLRQAPFRGSGHRRGGLCIFGHHHGCCPRFWSVSALVVAGADHPRFLNECSVSAV